MIYLTDEIGVLIALLLSLKTSIHKCIPVSANQKSLLNEAT